MGGPDCAGGARAYLVIAINVVTSYVNALVAPIDSLPLPVDMAPTTTTWRHVGSEFPLSDGRVTVTFRSCPRQFVELAASRPGDEGGL